MRPARWPRRVTPTLMSACATPASEAAAAKPAASEGRFLRRTWQCLRCGRCGTVAAARGARTAPRPPKNRSATTGAMSAWLSSPSGCSQVNIQFIMPNSSIVSGLCSARRGELGARSRRSRRRTRRRRGAAPPRTRLRLGRREELHVLGQHAVLGLRAGVGGEEARRSARRRRCSGAGIAASTSATSACRRATCVLGDLDQQLVLVAHVVVERRLRDAAGLGDLVHRRRRVAALREQLAPRARGSARAAAS